MTQVPGLSSSEDDSLALEWRSPRKVKAAKHSTPKELGPRGPGRAGRLRGSPVRTPVGVRPVAALRKKRLSSVRASVGSRRRSGTGGGRSATGQPPEAPAQPEETGALRAASQPWNPGLPGVPDAAGKKKRGPRGRATEMERVRQWEARLLQQIEEAVHHELTIESEDCTAEIRDVKRVGAS
ncbi:coiled-coil domain-containing protein 201 [Thomomys bottae]